jgi:hypothetical protein
MAQESLLRVELERSGGHVPTFRPKYVVAVAALTAAERAQLAGLIEGAGFFRLPARFSKTAHPDAFEYRLAIQDASASHAVIYHDGDGHPESLDDLADWIIDHQSR